MDLQQELHTIHELLLSAQAKQAMILQEGCVDSSRLERVLGDAEACVLKLRMLAEVIRPRECGEDYGTKKPMLFHLPGSIEVNEFGWLHIKLDTLLPNCKYKTPQYLQNSITRLLKRYTAGGNSLPQFERAMLIIEEHCSIENRQVYDQDNKGWKAIPNALKGVIFPDDDQFTLEIAMLARMDDSPSCHIYVMGQEDAGEYFFLRSGNYGYTL